MSGDPVPPLYRILRGVSTAMSATMRGMIRVYQLTVSPMLGDRCRFFPSCSAYAMQALQRHGPVRGSYLSLTRLCKCHPWHPGGVDEVPPRCDVGQHATRKSNPLQ